VQIRRSRVEARLDAKGTPKLESLDQFFLFDDLVGASRNGGKRLVKLVHAFLVI
jgi:hypothetical protein